MPFPFLSDRYQRAFQQHVLSADLWRGRIVFWLGALGVGLVASAFAIAANWVQFDFLKLFHYNRFLPLLISPAIFAMVAYITIRFVPSAAGSGIQQAIAARQLNRAKDLRYLLGSRVMMLKIVLTLLAMLGGASIGREGPTVQVGAALLLMFTSFGNLKMEKDVVLAGAAAGVAAAFNTPLAGIVFAIEEMARSFEHRNSSVLLTTIVLAGFASLSIVGNYSYFGYVVVLYNLQRDWLAVLASGITGGLMGGLFAYSIIAGSEYLRRRFSKEDIGARVQFAAAAGLTIAALGFLTHGQTYGTGYELTQNILHGTHHASFLLAPAKLIATTISSLAGIPGGIFSPSLAVGATLGSAFSPFFIATPMQGIIILFMVAYFAGVTQAPITAFVIVLEITGKTTSALPLIAAALIAAGIGRLICPRSLYHALAQQFVTDLSEETREKEAGPLVS